MSGLSKYLKFGLVYHSEVAGARKLIRTLRRSHLRSHLMTDPKTRKVIIVENALMSTRVKNMIARVLFDNLQVRV